MNLKALEEKRNDLKSQMGEMLETSKKEERALTTEEASKFDEMEKEIKNIDATIERNERMESMEQKEVKVENTRELTAEEKRMYTSVEERDDYNSFAEYIRCQVEKRADASNLTKGDNGAVIPKTIVNKIIDKVEEISPVYKLATHYNIPGTATIPTEDASADSITVAFATEFTDLTSHSNKFGTIELTGYLYGALTKISKSLLKNNNFNLTNWVIAKMAKKIAKFLDGVLLNGATSKVSGIAGSYDSTKMNKALASKSAVTSDELIDVQELVPDEYQADAIWIMNKKTRTAIRKLKDSDNNYLLNRDLSSKWGYTLLGKDVYCSDNVSELGAVSKNVIFYGDLSGLSVKESETAEIQILQELFAAQHAIGVVAWGEIDAKVENKQKIAVVTTPAS